MTDEFFIQFSKMVKFSKVVVCGMKGVGKTAILEQVIYGSITEKSVSFFSQTLTNLNFNNFLKGTASNNRRYLCGKC